jgi:hypothetical protein
MDRPKKLISQQKAEELQETLSQQQSQSGTNEFASVEEMLRHDALHTPVPPAIARRLEESVAQLPAPARSWWRRLLGQ